MPFRNVVQTLVIPKTLVFLVLFGFALAVTALFLSLFYNPHGGSEISTFSFPQINMNNYWQLTSDDMTFRNFEWQNATFTSSSQNRKRDNNNLVVANLVNVTMIAKKQHARLIYAGPSSGADDYPNFRHIEAADLPDGVLANTSLIAGSGIALVHNGPNSVMINCTVIGSSGGTVTAVNLALPLSVFSVDSEIIISSGTLSASLVNQSAGTFFAAPSGADGNPVFRTISMSDLPSNVATNTTFTAGAGISIVNGVINATSMATVSLVDLSLPASLFSTSGSPITTNGTLVAIFVNQSAHTFFAAPSGASNGVPVFRSIDVLDLPSSVLKNTTILAGTGIQIIHNLDGSLVINSTVIGSSGGTVTSIDMSLPSSLFSTNGGPISISGTLAATLINQNASTFFAAPVGLAGTPVFRSITLLDLPSNVATNTSFTAGNGISIVSGMINATSTATVSLVNLSLPISLFTISGGPITTNGTLTATLVNQSAGTFFAAPSGATSGPPTFRAIDVLDLPTNVLKNTTIVAGTGIAISHNNDGSIVINSTVIGSSGGTVTSIDMSLPSSLFTTSGGPISISGTLAATLINQNTSTFFAAPIGIAGTPTFRSITLLDLPSNVATNTSFTAGNGISIVSGMINATSTATVSLVNLSLPTFLFTTSGNPITSSGTLTATLVNQSANTIFAGPDGVIGSPTFRTLVALDIPNLDTSKFTTGLLTIVRGGTNSASALFNNRIMVSSGGAIMEAAALTNGQLLIGSTGAAPTAASLAGTTNQVTVTNGAGSITLSTPQNIHTAAAPTFASQTLTATTNQLTMGTTNTVTISASAPSASRVYTLHDAGANANVILNTGGALTVTNTGSTGQVLVLTSATTATWQTPSAPSITSLKDVQTSTVTTTTSWASIASISLTSTGTWQCRFDATISNTLGLGSILNDMQYQIATTSGTALDNSYRRYGTAVDGVIVTSAEVVVSSAPQTVFLEWKQTTILIAFSTKASTGRALRCFK